MGRRKIEIEPITNERNRSVTFLKRKNGLFKKAYELGVLCSVDIAVIVFEERPGHPVKLHQYCSTNVNNVLQRFVRFDGTRECKGPTDFNDKLGHDDDDGEDEDEDDDKPAVTSAPPPKSMPKAAAGRRASGNAAGPSKPPSSGTLRLDAPPHEHPAKRTRLAAELDGPPFGDAPAGPPLSAAAYRYLSGLGPPPAPAHLGLFPPAHGWPPAHLPPAAAHPSLFPLYPAAPAHDFGGLPAIRGSAAAASAYASALARGDVHAAHAASAALYAHAAPPPQAPPPPPFAGAGDLFDFEWPEHRARPSRGNGGAAPRMPPPVRAARDDDLSWLEFLGGGGSDGADPPDSRPPEQTVNDWLEGVGELRQPRPGTSRSSSHSGASFLPSPVHSEAGRDLS